MATSERLVEREVREHLLDRMRMWSESVESGVGEIPSLDRPSIANVIREAAAALSAAEAKAERYRVALRGLMPYRAHLRTCEVTDTEFCTCGLKQVADAARAALTEGERDG